MKKNKITWKYSNQAAPGIYVLISCALLLAGCAQQTSTPQGIRVQDNTLIIEQSRGISMTDATEAAEDVLAEMHFNIKKADMDSGLIRTRPLPGAQFFEFWRSDNIGAENNFAANLHSIRRTVELNLNQQERELHIGCDVLVQRLSIPEHQVSSSARVYQMFSQSKPSLQRLALNPDQQTAMAWIDLENDSLLAAEILKRIEARIVQQTSNASQMVENET